MPATMGVDIGTTGCKAAAFDEGGRLLSIAYREYPLRHPEPGAAELDSAEVLCACDEVIREACAKSGASVEALAISSQGESFTALDGEGKILHPALVSSDARPGGQIPGFLRSFPKERLYQITGHTPQALFTIFKLLWFREKRGALFERARYFLCFEDLLQKHLGIEPHIGWPLAGRTLLFDVNAHRWNAELLSLAGVQESQLAKPVPSGSVCGIIPDDRCDALGLAKGCRVVAGGHDQSCGALGAGVVEEGIAMYGSGTVDCITPCFRNPIRSANLAQANLVTYDFALPGHYTTVAYSLTGGNLFRWFRDEFGGMEKNLAKSGGREAYDLLLDQMPDEPSRLLVLPYFTPSGTPYFDAATPGAILGLRLDTGRGEILRGLLEGVAMEMRLNLDLLGRNGIPVRELRAIGGGARNRKLLQLKADALGVPLTTVKVSEAGCLGAAMLSRAALGGATIEELSRHWVERVETLEPKEACRARYQERFESYQRAYPVLKELSETMHKPA